MAGSGGNDKFSGLIREHLAGDRGTRSEDIIAAFFLFGDGNAEVIWLLFSTLIVVAGLRGCWPTLMLGATLAFASLVKMTFSHGDRLREAAPDCFGGEAGPGGVVSGVNGVNPGRSDWVAGACVKE